MNSTQLISADVIRQLPIEIKVEFEKVTVTTVVGKSIPLQYEVLQWNTCTESAKHYIVIANMGYMDKSQCVGTVLDYLYNTLDYLQDNLGPSEVKQLSRVRTNLNRLDMFGSIVLYRSCKEKALAPLFNAVSSCIARVLPMLEMYYTRDK